MTPAACCRLVLGAVLGATAGCSPRPPETMSADVVLTDGTRFHFAAPVRTSLAGDDCALEGLDDVRRFGLTFLWRPAAMGAGTTFSLEDPSGLLRLVLTRPHPTDSNVVRLSQVTQGIAFVTYWNGCDFQGTFDSVRLDHTAADDAVHIGVSAGDVPGAL